MKKYLMFCLVLLVSCSGVFREARTTEIGDPPVMEAPVLPPVEEKALPMVQIPEFRPVSEDISPLNKKIISISVRNASLRDVAKIVADSANLNLVMDKGVNPDAPVTVTLNHVSIKTALDILFSSVDYFYEVRKNLLVIKAQETVIFELGHPSMINNYSVSLGGDILGGTSSGGSGSAGGAGGSASASATNLKGDVSLEGKTSEEAQDLWRSISESIANILDADDAVPGPKPYFSINRMTGTIMVTASKWTLEKVEYFLDKVKESLNRQVMIEARIVEVQLSDSLMYGIDWDFLNEYKNGSVNVGTLRFSDVVSATGPAFQFGITDVNFTSLLKALQTQGNVNVLSNPRVSLMNGQAAMLSVGRNTNFISRVQTTTSTAAASTGTVTFTIETSSILSGLIIGIVSYINPDGNVSMTITPIVTDLISLEDKNLGSIGSNSVSLSLPTVDLREMSTTVRVKDGEMVVIGGLINRKESDRYSGIPFLSRIPMIGYLFRTKEKIDQRTELVIMLRPVLARAE